MPRMSSSHSKPRRTQRERRRRHPATIRSKHLKLDQRKLDRVKRYFAVSSDQEAVEKAVDWLVGEEGIIRVLQRAGGTGVEIDDVFEKKPSQS